MIPAPPTAPGGLYGDQIVRLGSHQHLMKKDGCACTASTVLTGGKDPWTFKPGPPTTQGQAVSVPGVMVGGRCVPTNSKKGRAYLGQTIPRDCSKDVAQSRARGQAKDARQLLMGAGVALGAIFLLRGILK